MLNACAMADTPWDLVAARMADLRALQGAIAVLSWDQETYLPPKGALARGDQLATLQGLHHQKLTAPDLGDALAASEAQPANDATRRATLRALRFDRDRAIRVPERLVRELAQLQSAALVAWREAREKSEFARFAPHLERLVALRREQADAIGVPPGGERYDTLLEGYEEGMRVARLEPLFARLTSWLVPLVARLADAPPPPDPFAGRRFDADAQWRFSFEILEAMGFDLQAGRLDRSVHPFSLSADPGDVRLTTRIAEDLPFSSVFSVIHEGGHGLYEQGLPVEHRRTFLCAASSMGLHESQSRLWENLVGRSLPFWKHFYPRFQARFPALEGVPLRVFHRALNRVERSLIRTESDELTYNLHIALRFELELGLVRGGLRVADLPAAWNDRMQTLLGRRPARDAEGVLQDIHWATGDIGYFPTYTLGNLYAASLFAAAQRALPRLEDDIAEGRLLPLRDWLRERVHRVGRALTAEEIVRGATGRGLQDDDFRAYLEAKYASLYSA
jgi:carboxypeptidase Taq